jgi:hypothetical protein
VVETPDLDAAHTAEKFLCLIRASTVEAIRLLMVDPLHFEAAMRIVPSPGFVGMDNRALRDSRA